MCLGGTMGQPGGETIGRCLWTRVPASVTIKTPRSPSHPELPLRRIGRGRFSSRAARMQKPSPPAGEPLTVDDFLRLVVRSGLVEQAQLQAALRALPPGYGDRPEVVADHLVRQGKLSRFQARKLLQGTGLGLVLGPFQILAPIGKGGMGTVYLARDQRSSRLLALKILPPRRARTEERLLARFLREMEMSQRVSHPHLAWTFEAGRHHGIYYIAMEFIPGKSLFRLVADEGPLAVPRAARLAAEVASALGHAHAQGLIHRDIKPANIMVTPHDHAKVLDLGLALVQGEKGADREVIGGQGYVVGSMDYIAPEQIDDPLAVDGRADIYGLGCTLYYALTGQMPFPGGTNREKMQRHRTEEPRPIERFNPSVPRAFVALVARMMAKDPDKRFPTAAALEAELRHWQEGPTVLPLDRPGDRTFEVAVAAIEAAEPDEEHLREPILDEAPPLMDEPSALFRWVFRLGPWQYLAVAVGAVLLLLMVYLVLSG
jgi:eukaryotic-like serine/threonine-protein kinase